MSPFRNRGVCRGFVLALVAWTCCACGAVHYLKDYGIESKENLSNPSYVNALVKALKDPNYNARWYAFDALGTMRSENAVPGLIAALDSPEQDAPYYAAITLGLIGPKAKDAVPALLAKVSSSQEYYVRWVAIDAVDKIGNLDVNHLAALKKIVESDPDSSMRDMAAAIYRRYSVLVAPLPSGAATAPVSPAARPDPAVADDARIVRIASGVRAPATTNPGKGIAVWRLEGKSGLNRQDLDSLSGLLTTLVENASGRKALGEADIDLLLKGEEKRQQCGVEDTTCIAEIGNALGLPEAVSGDLGQVGRIWLLNLRLINTREAKIIQRTSTQIDGSIEDVLAVMPKAVENLFR